MGGNYQAFLDSKTDLGSGYGFEPIEIPDFLFPFQRNLCEWSIRRGRGSLYENYGLGKTIQQLVWADNVVRHTNKPVLILTPLSVSPQTVREATKFGIDAEQSRDGKFGKRIIVTNYEKLIRFNPSDFSGVVCDESSCIKDEKSKTKSAIGEFMRTIPYRLLCTATPAPNDYIELGTSAEVLGEMGFQDMLTRFFRRETKSERPFYCTAWARQMKWILKGHAPKDFWRWVCSWARACRKPSDLGFSDDGYILPELINREHVIIARKKRDGWLFDLPAVTLQDQREERRRTIEERCEKVAELVSHDRPAIAWGHLNDECDMMEKIIPGAVQVSGSDSDEEKEEKLLAFINGQVRVMVSKPVVFGYGLNLQHCAHMTFFPSHCYDETTEILTKRGWMTFGNVTLDDEVATTNRQSLEFEWQRPTEVIWSPYEGPMIHFSSKAESGHYRGLNLLVTPNHKMFVKRCEIRYRKNCGEWMLKDASDLLPGFKKQEYRMLSVPKGFLGKKLEEVEIPDLQHPPRISMDALNKSGDRRGMDPASWTNLDQVPTIKVRSLPAGQFMQLAGWYLSEGYCGCRNGYYDGQITITQTDKNPEHREEIIAMLKSIPGLNVYHKTKDIRCCSRQLALYLVDQFGAGSRHKFIPGWVKDLDISLLTILRDTMLKGDGCSNKRGEEKVSYKTVSKRLADDFSEICLKTGIRGSVHLRGIEGEYGDCYEVTLSRKETEPTIITKPKVIEYHGMIGCVSVPNRTLIVRRNGIPIISGNSFEQTNQAIHRCHRFGQKSRVVVDMISSEGEAGVLANYQRKLQAADIMFDRLVSLMYDHLNIVRTNPFTEQAEVPSWLTNNNLTEEVVA